MYLSDLFGKKVLSTALASLHDGHDLFQIEFEGGAKLLLTHYQTGNENVFIENISENIDAICNSTLLDIQEEISYSNDGLVSITNTNFNFFTDTGTFNVAWVCESDDYPESIDVYINGSPIER